MKWFKFPVLMIVVLCSACSAKSSLRNENTNYLSVTIYDGTSGDGTELRKIDGTDQTREKWLRQLWEAHAAIYSGKIENYNGPDYPYVQIKLRMDGKEARLESWHPIVRDSEFIVTAGGLRKKEKGENREETLKSQPQDYQTFVRNFDAIIDAVEELSGPLRFQTK
ncbi:MAG: hypothetical protein JWO08_4282 [Verrucomicrobiaceae bacterium]|nr:hypothetical protein [Verrucomicrobiaceae bacterium]